MTDTLGERIRAKRQEKGWSQSQLGEGLVTASMISQIESDKAKPSYKVLTVLAARLEEPLEYFLTDIEVKSDYDTVLLLARSRIAEKNYTSALELLFRLLDMSHTHFPTEEKEVLFNIGSCYLYLNEPRKAIHYLTLSINQFLNVSEVLMQHERIAACYLLLSDAFKLDNNFLDTYYHLQKSLEYVKKSKIVDNYQYAEVLFKLADLNKHLFRLPASNSLYGQALSIFTQTEGLREMGKVYQGLAELQYESGDHETANEYAAKAIHCFKALDLVEETLDMQRRTILFQRENKSDQETISKLFEMATVSEKLEGSLGATLYLDIANLYMEQDDFENANSFAYKAFASADVHDPDLIASVNQIIGRCFLNQQMYEQAKEYFVKSLELHQKTGNLYGFIQCSEYVSECLSEMGHYKEALIAMSDSHNTLVEQLQSKGLLAKGGYIFA